MIDPNNTNYVICADIGGSHIAVATIDLANRVVVPGTFVRIEVNSKGSWPDILKTWADAFRQADLLSCCCIQYIALAMPGPFDYENGISYIKGLDKYESLYGLNIKHFLAKGIGISPENIRFRNDAEAMIAGEVFAGTAGGSANIMGITLGTGFGSAHFLNGYTKDLDLGSRSFKNSIADDYLSTRWFLKRYAELTGISAVGVKELAQLAARSGFARDVFKEFAGNLSDFLKDPVDLLNPDAVIICGNIARSSALFTRHLDKPLRSRIVLGKLGEHAALLGAAALFEPDLATNLLRL